jgi:hypothetical protein
MGRDIGGVSGKDTYDTSTKYNTSKERKSYDKYDKEKDRDIKDITKDSVKVIEKEGREKERRREDRLKENICDKERGREKEEKRDRKRKE